ncbi:MAG: 3-phosphoshikimate 1-carboxyvinyltransferase, partial [Rikenellaceae bacterium]|nr:3-phosphoshikimate 1-carboxyvinyltransferase [Rikenellaceae bacterium]
MKRIISPSKVGGKVTPPCSKSYAQRALAVALLADGESTIGNLELCDDTRSAIRCIEALGAEVT